MMTAQRLRIDGRVVVTLRDKLGRGGTARPTEENRIIEWRQFRLEAPFGFGQRSEVRKSQRHGFSSALDRMGTQNLFGAQYGGLLADADDRIGRVEHENAGSCSQQPK